MYSEWSGQDIPRQPTQVVVMPASMALQAPPVYQKSATSIYDKSSIGMYDRSPIDVYDKPPIESTEYVIVHEKFQPPASSKASSVIIKPEE